MARYFLEIVPANPNSNASVTYRRPRSDTVLLIFTAALVVYLVLTPLGMLIWNSFKATPPGVPGPLTLDNFINAYLDPTLYPLVANSFL